MFKMDVLELGHQKEEIRPRNDELEKLGQQVVDLLLGVQPEMADGFLRKIRQTLLEYYNEKGKNLTMQLEEIKLACEIYSK